MKWLLCSLFVLILGIFGILNPLRNFTQYLLNPIQFGLNTMAVNIKESTNFFFNLGEIRKQNIQLIQHVEELQTSILELKKAADENKALKEQLKLKDTYFEKNLLMANVMGNPLDLSGSSIYIDKGSRLGIKPGNTVIKGNYLIGIIKEVTSERSLVELITSPTVSMNVMDIDSNNKTEGLATGQYGTTILVTRILPNEDIKVGDTMITSGKDGFFSSGLAVGKVREVVQIPVEPLKSAYLDTFINLSKLDRVFVVL